ncbi:hypothetical protein CTEN210_18307 [Chaetoceros tenuissimus]|uniref:Uncharacterized protein n=1 Tax=Chaetoceros tenuissimus TaxID=426638 RepID=A0AAD3HFX1_9STRA|nr:hypothetical protein CTEN210_18307 [Chaetoceros tenuissimus]
MQHMIELQAGLRRPVSGHYPIFTMKDNAEERGIADFHTAATIRHPCSRFISAFRYLKSDLCNEGNKKQREKIGLNDAESVDEYVQYLEAIQWNNVFGHFKPQYPWIMNQDQTAVDVDNFLCNEQWDEGIHRIKSIVGVEEIDTRRLLNYRGLGSSSDHFLQNKHEKCKDLKPETRAAIERFYAMDYCLFGYDELPPEEDDVCIGTNNNAESLTKRFQDCEEKLNQGPYVISYAGRLVKISES